MYVCMYVCMHVCMDNVKNNNAEDEKVPKADCLSDMDALLETKRKEEHKESLSDKHGRSGSVDMNSPTLQDNRLSDKSIAIAKDRDGHLAILQLIWPSVLSLILQYFTVVGVVCIVPLCPSSMSNAHLPVIVLYVSALSVFVGMYVCMCTFVCMV